MFNTDYYMREEVFGEQEFRSANSRLWNYSGRNKILDSRLKIKEGIGS